MRKKRSIICIGTPTWEGNYAKSTVQLLSELAHQYRILYVDYQFTVKDVFATALRKQHAPVRRMLGIDQRLRKMNVKNSASVFVLTPPPIFPVNWINTRSIYNKVQSVNAQIVLHSIRSAMTELHMENPIVINAFNPSFGVELKGTLQESLLMYYCYDNISAAHWLGKHGSMLEQKFAAMADAIITSSDELTKRFPGQESKVFVVKNGVDFDMMQKGFSPVCNRQQSVAGYIGSIDERIDYDLLDAVIERLPNMIFRFIGRSTNKEYDLRLERHPNVELLGAHHPAMLPAFLREMDICMIPFAKNEFNRSVYPMKVNEYLAAGKPVVMTGFADLPEFTNIVHIADTAEEFQSSLKDGLASDSIEQKKIRQDFAKYQSWSKRAADLSEFIETSFLQRSAVTV